MKFYDILVSNPRIADDIEFATDIYRSLCNNVWYNYQEDEIIRESWRSSGRLVSRVRNQLRESLIKYNPSISEDYLHFYCSNGEGKISDDVHEFYDSNQIWILDGVYDKDINPDNHPMVLRRRGLRKLLGD